MTEIAIAVALVVIVIVCDWIACRRAMRRELPTVVLSAIDDNVGCHGRPATGHVFRFRLTRGAK